MNPIESKTAPVIYMYCPLTLVYMGSGLADANPVRENDWLVPGHSTTVAPPEFGTNQCAVFNGESWLVTHDYRGKRYWLSDGGEYEIVAIGVEPPHGALFERPAPLAIAVEDPDHEPEPEASPEQLRAIAYADPVTGSDRLFAQAMRMQMTGEIGYESVRDQASARYEEIRAGFPKR